MPGTTVRGPLRLETLDNRDLPSVFTVTTTADSGPGSLRQAILDTNAAAGADTIAFNIPGTGVHTIVPTSRLPKITDAVVIDGYTQPGSRPNTAGPGFVSNGLQTIQIDGNQVFGIRPEGLELTAGHSTVRGLLVQNFRGNDVQLWGDGNLAEGNTVFGQIYFVNGTGNLAGGTTPAARNDAGVIEMDGDFGRVVGNIAPIGVAGDHNQIGGTTPQERNVCNAFHTGLFISGSDNVAQGNFIGTNVTGMVRTHDANRRGGVYLDYTAQRNLIGGTTPGARNVICGSTAITINGATDNVIQGNYVGVNSAGTGTLFNATGIWVVSTNVSTPTGNLIGGTAPGAGNVISGNGIGIELTSAVNTRIQGNLIGVLPDGRTPAGNTQQGVRTASTAHDNLIGGTEPGAGNVIAYSRNLDGQSSGAGVEILWYAGSQFHPVNGNAILGNSIFGNAGLGIDIVELNGPFGVTPNDPGDADAGGNNRQNFPVLQSARTDGTTVTVQGTLNSTPGTTFRVEFFANPVADPSGFGEGERFVGFTTVTTDSAGNAAFTATLSAAVPSGQAITATATDSAGNSSEFSKAVKTGRSSQPNRPTSTLFGGGSISLTASGRLLIRGTPAADTVTVSPDAANANLLNVYFNDTATPARTFDLSQTTITGITFRGAGGNDSFTNTTAIVTLAYGGFGNDLLAGGSSADQLIGGPGADNLAGGAGNDTVRGGAANDTVAGGTGDDLGFGDYGNDLVDGDEGNDTLRGGFGRDLVRGGAGDDHLWGGIGNDELLAGSGDDWLDGGYGKDGVSGGSGDNVVLGSDRGPTTSVDLWANMFDFTSFAIGFGEIGIAEFGGAVHTEIMLAILDADPGDTFDVRIDVTGDASQIFDLGQVTADDSGTALLDLTDPPGLPALVDGVSVLEATDESAGGATVLSGTIYNPEDRHLMTNLWNASDPSLWGSADFNIDTRRLLWDFGGAQANTTYTLYVNGDATTGTAVAEVTTGDNGYATLQLLADANFPDLEEGSTVTVADASGATVLEGVFELLEGQ